MANTLLTSTIITREALKVLENKLVLLRHTNRAYSKEFAVEGAKAGAVVNVRKPPRYIGRSGWGLSPEDAQEELVSVAIDVPFGVDLVFSQADLVLSIDDFSKRFISPAVAAIANKIDSDIAAIYDQVYEHVGTPGTPITDLETYLMAGVALDDNSAPDDDSRGMFISPYMGAKIVNGLRGLTEDAEQISKQYVKGRITRAAGFTWYTSQNLKTHTYGVYAGTPLVNGANQIGNELITDGWSSGASTLNKGDVFTLAGVYKINMQSRENTEQLQRFVVRELISDTAGAMTIKISPSIVIVPQQKTVSGSPADNAPITVLGATGAVSRQGLALHPDAIAFASVDLPLPGGVDMAGRASSKQSGLAIRMIRQYDINTNNMPCRLDVFYGIRLLRPELICRVAA
jgi:hypothetical protein